MASLSTIDAPLNVIASPAMSASTAGLIAWQSAQRARVDAAIAQTLHGVPAGQLGDAMRYAATGGKRLRALLVYAAATLSGAEADIADAPAVAVELLHAYSLVHDDLPCMDDDALRRGQPSCHIAFGEAMALLAGDALQTQAFLALAQSRMPEPATACALLAQAAGANGMAGGQARDLQGLQNEAATVEALEAMHQMKTGALIHASVMLGAACGVALPSVAQTALARYAACVGLAFQVADDVLDVEGAAPTLGKTVGKDAAQNKTTYVSLLGLAEAKRRMHRLSEEAQEALLPFGAQAWPLKTLATQAVVRDR